MDAPRLTRETGTVFVDSRYPAAARDRLASMGHDADWVDPELKSWGRPVAVVKDRDAGLLRGGVYALLTGFESMAVGI